MLEVHVAAGGTSKFQASRHARACRVLRWWFAALACVMAMPSPSEACSCNYVTEPEYVQDADVAFDGTVLGDAPRDPPKPCALPTKTRARPGCLEIGVFDREACTERARDGWLRRGDYNGDWQDDPKWEATQEFVDGPVIRAQMCKLASGSYTLYGYGGFPVSIAFDAKLGGSVMLSVTSEYYKWRTRVRVDTLIKGDPPHEVFLVSTGGGGGSCGKDSPNPGERWRFFARKLDDGDIGINACSGAHKIDDTTPKLPRVVAPPVVAPTPAPPTLPRKSSGGCTVGEEPGLALALLAFVRRRSCRRNEHGETRRRLRRRDVLRGQPHR